MKARCFREDGRLTAAEWSDRCSAVARGGVDGLCGQTAPPPDPEPAPTVLDHPVRTDFN